MTDLVVSVRLKADGSGLIGSLRLGKAEVAELERALDAAGGSARKMSADTGAAGAAARDMAAAVGAAGAAAEGMARDQRQASQATADSNKRIREQEQEAKKAAAALNRHAYGARQMGQNVADAGLQIAGGIDPIRAISQQLGQMGYAASEMGGKVGKVGAFLVGPWGIALTIGTALLAPFIGKLFEGSHAAEDFLDKATKAATAADSFGSAQSLLGKVIDLTTGKLKTQNQVLIESIRLQALAGIAKAKADQKTAGDVLATAGRPTFGERVSAASSLSRGSLLTAGVGVLAATVGMPQNPQLADIATRYRQGAIDIKGARIEIEKLGLSAETTNKELLNFIGYGTAVNDEKANQQVLDALDGKGIASDLKPYVKPKKGPKPKSTAARDEFGRDAGDRIAGIAERFEQTPSVVRQANAALRDLDDLIDDLGRKKPPGFQALIASAEQAKQTVRDGLLRELTQAFDKPKTLADQAAVSFGQLDALMADLSRRKPPGFEAMIASAQQARAAVEEGLNRPFADYVTEQQNALAVQQLINQGRDDEAEALRVVQALERTIGQQLTPERRAAVLATVQALRAEQHQTELNEAAARKYHQAIGEIRGTVEDMFQAFTRGDLGQLLRAPGKLLDTFQSLKGRQLFDNLFGGAFEKLDDLVDGTAPLKDAAEKMADAVDKVTDQTSRTTNALDALAKSASRAAQGVSTGGADQLRALLAQGNGVTGPGPDGGPIAGQVTVQGRRIYDTRSLFSEAATSVAKAVLSGGKPSNISESNAQLAKDIGTKVGKAFDGSATGGFIAGVAKSFGVKLSGSGAQIGGAIGSLLPIPGGNIIGSIAGGIIGKLFGSTKKGSGTVGAVNGVAGVTGVTGNSSSYRAAASGLAGSVADGIQGIIDALGGELGNFAVSIGQRNKKFVVDSSGSGKTKGSGTQKFGSEEEAVAAALADAIADGAIKGISDAMQRALRSSSDIDRGVREALKVRDVERLIGGLGGQLTQIFADYDREAAERVRVAKAYGLDLVAVEKVNAEQRAKLLEDTLQARVGSLKDFLANVQYGDLFEGSAADRRKAILAEIDDARTDADAGVDGAAQRLAELYRQLIETSKEAYGTAGSEFASDRSSGIADVERLLKAEQDRVNAAGKATTDAVLAGNDLLDEISGQIAFGNNRLDTIADSMAGGGSGYGMSWGDALSTMRQTLLS